MITLDDNKEDDKEESKEGSKEDDKEESKEKELPNLFTISLEGNRLRSKRPFIFSLRKKSKELR